MAKRKNYLPKRIGSVKVPKRLRRGVVGQALASPAGQAIIAALILKAAASTKDRLFGRRDDRPGAADLRSLAAASQPTSHQAAGVTATPEPAGPSLNVKHALGQAALAFIVGLGQPREPAPKPRRSGPRPPRATAPVEAAPVTSAAPEAPARPAEPQLFADPAGDGAGVPPEARGAHSH